MTLVAGPQPFDRELFIGLIVHPRQFGSGRGDFFFAVGLGQNLWVEVSRDVLCGQGIVGSQLLFSVTIFNFGLPW